MISSPVTAGELLDYVNMLKHCVLVCEVGSLQYAKEKGKPKLSSIMQRKIYF